MINSCHASMPFELSGIFEVDFIQTPALPGRVDRYGNKIEPDCARDIELISVKLHGLEMIGVLTESYLELIKERLDEEFVDA